MRNKLYKILAAGFGLALAFTFSCSSGDIGDGGGGGGSGNNIANYKTKQIGDQVWMAENLNYAVSDSKCYDNKSANCDKYGRLYDWATAMALPSSCNSSSCANQIQPKHRGICPSGWHIPSEAEWNELLKFVDSKNGGDCSGEKGTCYESETAGRYLKATSGWYGNGNGEDKYGFAALPGGFGISDGSFGEDADDGIHGIDRDGDWWSATDGGIGRARASNLAMHYDNDEASRHYNRKSVLLSVRCLKD